MHCVRFRLPCRPVFRPLSLVLPLFFSLALSAQVTRTYAGGYSTNWKTVGAHGHDVPCSGGVDACDHSDFARGNLDNSIGFRGGLERDFASWRAVRLVGGLDATVSDTEYNFSQRDLGIFAAAATGGIDVSAWTATLGIRYGLGPYLTSDLHGGVHSFKEVAVTVPLSGSSSVRFLRRTAVNSMGLMNGVRLAGSGSEHSAAVAKEFGLLVVSRPGPATDAHWSFAATSGMSEPGKLVSGSLNLSRASFHRFTVARELGALPLEARLTWTSFAHESELEGVFNGYPKNLRSKTIDSYGVGIRFTRKIWRGLSAHATGGVEIADWTDDHGLLVRGNQPASRTVVAGGIEPGANGGIGLRYIIGRGMGVEVMGEQAFWPGIRLGERRTGIAFVIAR
jgi:hypothetical protein